MIKANHVHKRPVRIKFFSFQSASNKLKIELRSLISAKKAVNFNSNLKRFSIEFRFEFYIKIKPIESKIIYLLYIFYKLIILYLKVFKFHLFLQVCTKSLKNNYVNGLLITFQ
jgi:hypothetical protein